MGKVILFFGILFISLGVSAEGIVDDFNTARHSYLKQIGSIQPLDSSRCSTGAYIQFSNFILTQMVKYEFLTEKNIHEFEITDIFRFYIEALKVAGVDIDSSHFYIEMMPGVSFCFKCPEEAESLSSFCITVAG